VSPSGSAYIQLNAGNDYVIGYTWTIALWTKRPYFNNNGASHPSIISRWTGVWSGIWYHSSLGFYIHSNGPSYQPTPTVFLPDNDEWFHLAFVADGSTLTVFINGNQQGQFPMVPFDRFHNVLGTPGNPHGWSVVDDYRLYANKIFTRSQVLLSDR
jgi:hypothetical protein